MKARYNRISTPNQKMERQIAKQNPDEKLFNDIVSGSVKFAEREMGKTLIQEIKAGRINWVSVSAIDRLGRNLQDLINTLEDFENLGVTLRVDNLGLESRIDGKPNPTFKLIVSVMMNVAEMERNTLLERQREGIAIAKANGTYKGRMKGSVESNAEVLKKYKEVVKFLNRKQSLRNTAKLCNVALGTVQKVHQIIKQQEKVL
ncbi:recombinase family protein [Flavobacterium sp. PLA-1-15]|uniref:recombinase family protein n=1 Tax=Flavobacterium sp. PLA-1-15 TaxID=3380533 RepID=UPI003B79E0D3